MTDHSSLFCKSDNYKRIIFLAVAAVMMLGGWLRGSKLELMEFKGDEAALHDLAVKQAKGEFQFHGIPSSVGLKNPPATVYLFAIPALFSSKPIVAAGFVAMLGAASIVLLYLLARNWVQPIPALCAALLFAVSPWAILLSRKIWAQDLLPFFTLALLVSLMRWHRTGRWGWAITTGAALAILTQIHYSTFAVLPAVLFIFWQRRSKRTAQQFAVVAGLCLLLWIPFITVAIAGDAFAPGSYSVAHDSHKFFRVFPKALLWLGRLPSYGGWEAVAGAKAHALDAAPPAALVMGVWLLIIACGLYVAVRGALKERELWIVPLWLLLPAVVFSFHRIYYHYLVVSLPCIFIIAAIIAERLLQSLQHQKLGAVALMLATLLLAVDALHFYFQFMRSLDLEGGAPGDYGICYREKLAVADAMVSLSPKSDYEVIDCSVPRGEPEVYTYLYKIRGGKGAAVVGEAVMVPTFVLMYPHGPELRIRGQRNVATRATEQIEVRFFQPEGR